MDYRLWMNLSIKIICGTVSDASKMKVVLINESVNLIFSLRM